MEDVEVPLGYVILSFISNIVLLIFFLGSFFVWQIVPICMLYKSIYSIS